MRRGDELLVIAEDELQANNMLTRQELKRHSFSGGELAAELAAELTDELSAGATKVAGRLRSMSLRSPKRSPKKKAHKPSTPTTSAKPIAAAAIDRTLSIDRRSSRALLEQLPTIASPPRTAEKRRGSAGGSQQTRVSFQEAVTVEGKGTPGVTNGDLAAASPELRSSSSGEIGPPGTPEEATTTRTTRPGMAAPMTAGSPSTKEATTPTRAARAAQAARSPQTPEAMLEEAETAAVAMQKMVRGQSWRRNQVEHQQMQKAADNVQTVLRDSPSGASAAGEEALQGSVTKLVGSIFGTVRSQLESEAARKQRENAIGGQETLAELSAALRSKQLRLQFMAVVYVQQMARAWLARHRKAKEEALAEASWDAEESRDAGFQPRRDATGLTPAQSAALRKALRSVTHRPRIVTVVGWQHNFGRVLRALDQRLPKGSIIFILSKLHVWERRRDLATSGMAELGGALEVEPF